MISQRERADLLRSLHVKGDPLVIFNIWDAGSAKALQEIGAKVVGTGSWSVAAAHGYEDGENLSLELVLANVERICASVDLPVTIDFEGGYGQSPAQVQENVTRVIQAGAVGINFEDQIVGGEGLYSPEDQSARIKAVREAAEHASIPLFINARTDVFLKSSPADHDDNHLNEATRRAEVYAKSGASGFFAPGLRDARLIEKMCAASPLPVNILVMPGTPLPKQMASMGVGRISYGAGPYRQMIEALKEAGRNALSVSEERSAGQ